MNTKALITTLAVLGSTSSLAMARPATDHAPSASANVHRSYPAPIPAPVVRDHRAPYRAPAPVVVRPVAYHHEGGRDWDQDRDWDRGGGYARQPRPTLLADGLTYNAGEYRKDIVLEGRGRFNTLAVNEDGGCTFIKEVRIEFIGGAVQSIPVNQTLRDNQSMTFDLDGTNRAINRVFVYRADGNQMNIGSPSGGEFSVTAL